MSENAKRFVQSTVATGNAEIALVYLGDIADEERLPKPWIAFRLPERDEVLIPLIDAVTLANHVHALALTARDYKLSDALDRLGVKWIDED